MARQTNPEPQKLELATSGPIVLAGNPRSLRGKLNLQNTGADRFTLRRLPLAVGLTGKKALAAVREGGVPEVRISPGTIRPGHKGPVSLTLRLDPHTPPGEYHAEMDVAGQMVPVILHVIERILLRVSPAQLILENLPDQTVSKRIIVTNKGNVPLTVGKIGAVFLDDDLLICRTLRLAAASVDDELRPFEEYLARILLSAKKVAESSGVLRIYNRSGETTVQPGEVVPIDLDIRIPPGLDRRGRYRGVVALQNANLSFVIVPTSGPEPPEEEAAPKRRTRKTEEK